MVTTVRSIQFRTSVRAVAAAAGIAMVGSIAVASSGPAVAAPTGKASLPAYGTIWVVNNDTEVGGTITEYAPNANGNVAPVAQITGDKTQMTEPNAMAVTSTGALWVAQASGDALTQYAPGAHGNAAPARVIAGSNTGIHVPIALTLAPDGSLWVMNNGPATLLHFAATAHGNVAPIGSISGSNTTFSDMRGVAVTPDNKHIWVERTSNPSGSALLEFGTKQTGNVAPQRTISGGNTELGAYPYGIAVDAAGKIIVGSDNASAILTFAANANGNVAPIRNISGAATSVTEPSFLALDALGNIWFENYADSTVVEHAAKADGNVAPKRLIAGNKTHLVQPNAIAVFSARPSAPRHVSAKANAHHKVALSWHKSASDGGGVSGYAAYLKKSKHAHWKVIGTTKHRSLTVSGLSPKPGYRIAIGAVNNDGTSPKSKPAKIK